MSGRQQLPSEVAHLLLDASLAVPAGEFSGSGLDVEQPGLYSWWANPSALGALQASLNGAVTNPIYAGQTGATKWPSGRIGTATLASRIRANHIGGNISSSTFRLTIAAVLRERLGLELERPERLTRDSNNLLSRWIREHLSVVTVPYPDRDTLAYVEAKVLAILDPPLNLMGMDKTPVRLRIRQLRVAIA